MGTHACSYELNGDLSSMQQFPFVLKFQFYRTFDILAIAVTCRWCYWPHAMIFSSWNISWPLIGEILTGDPNCENDRDVNENHRQGQTKELLRFIESSCCNSDLVLLAGDFNFDKTHESYQLVTSANFEDTGSEEEDKRSTWGHPDNKSGNSPPHLLDYVFVRSNQEQIQVKATSTIPEKAFQWVLQSWVKSLITLMNVTKSLMFEW